jgi:hypothetical protein
MKRIGRSGLFTAVVGGFVALALAPNGVLAAPPGGGGSTSINTKGKQTPPIKLGTSGGWRYDLANGYCCGGTLGSLVQNAGGTYLLSNFHVLAADVAAGGNGRTAQLGDPVIQPGLIDVACNAGSAQTVGTLAGWADPLLGANADAAIAVVSPGMVDPSGAILGIGTISASTAAAYPGQPVKKTGRTSGFSRSKVSALNATISVSYENECAGAVRGTATFHGQIVAANKGSKFLAGGDSGSLMVEDVATNPRAVGLLFAGSSTSAIANPIGDVLDALGVSMVGVAAAPAAVAAGEADATAPRNAGLLRAMEVQNRNADLLAQVPDGNGHGVGVRADGTPVIKVFVETQAEAARAQLPAEIDGVPVEVEVIGHVVAF